MSLRFTLINNSSAAVTFTFSGYKDGVLQGTQTANANTTAGTFNTITFSSAFNDVDDIVITGFGTGTGTTAGQSGIRIDNIATTNAVPTFYYNTPQVFTAGTTITSLSPFQTSNGTFTYTISPTLPGGLSFSTSTGVISGTPTAGTTSAATDYTVTATNSAGSSTTTVNIEVASAASTVVDANAATNTMPENSIVGTTVGLTAYSYPANGTTNLAAGKTATATSLETGTFLASYTTDGSTTGNRWSSAFTDTQDLTIDLGASYAIGGVNLYWEVALGKDFQIQVSNDNISYTTIKSIYNNTTFNNVFNNLADGSVSTVGRYVRIHGINRGTQYGYSLYEVQVYQALTNTYSFTAGGNPGSLYAINSSTGVVTVNNAAIDYETATSRSVTIQATDGTTTTNSTFSIAITNVNEAPTITSNGGGATASISVAENTTAVTTVVGADVDAGDTKTYSKSGADAGKFTITAGGVLTFTTAPDFETPASAAGTNVYTVVVTVTDAGGLSDSQTLTVTVTNANDAPVITSNGAGTTATISVAENTTAVTTVTATDQDTGDTKTYSKSGADAGKFTLTSGGVLTFTTAPDFETPASAASSNAYTVVVTVTDAAGLTDNQTLTVNVTNVNEAPVITSNGGGATASVSVTENTTAVTTVVATDVDAGDTRTYSISGGADAGKFTITTGGVLTFTSAPNFASPGSAAGTNAYTVIATATDAGGLTVTQTLTVNVTNTAFLSPYAYRMPLTLNTVTAASTYTITSNQTSFPALIRISDPSLVYSSTSCTNKVQFPNGPAYDFAFTTSTSSAELNYQVESYDQTNGVLLVWVQIPSLTYQTNNNLYFYFGSATSTAATHTTSFYQNTWASDYKAVFHFNETTYTGSVTDGTSGGHTGTTVGMTSADLIAGKIGNAYSFDGTTKSIASNAVTITGAFTLSAWVYMTTASRDQKIMTNQAAAGSSTGGYKLGVYTDNTVEVESATAINRTSTPAAPTFANGAWHYVQGVYTGSSLFNYVDGQPYKVLATTTNASATTPLYIGVGEGGATYYFAGTIDEPRISNVAKSNDWIKFEYANQNNPSTFTTAGSVTTDATNVLTIPGGVIYTYNGSYTPNVTGVSTTPSFNGKENFVFASSAAISATNSMYGVTVNSGNTLTINSGQTLNVACNITNNGTIAYGSNSSNLTFNGSLATQSYTAAATSNVASVGTLIINNSSAGTVTINGGPVNIYNLVTLTKGSISVATSGTLTLKSTATQSAALDIITNAAYKIDGYVNVERFLTGGSLASNRGYRLLSSPVNQISATTSATNTFNLVYLNQHTFNSASYAGAFTGGPFSTDALAQAAGFSGKSQTPTVFIYKETIAASNVTAYAGKHVAITKVNATNVNTSNTSDPSATLNNLSLPIGNGFLMYFVGPSTRTSGSASGTNPTAGPPQDATLTANGYLNQGSFTVNLWYTPAGGTGKLSNNQSFTSAAARGFNMVGNPYPSTLDLSKLYTDNSASIDAVYMLSQRQGGTSQDYVAYSNSGSSAPGYPNYVVSGGGFIVHVKTATSTTSTLVFNESQKAPTTQLTGTSLIMNTPKAEVLTVDGKLGPNSLSTAQQKLMAMPVQTDAQPITGLYMKMEKDANVFSYCGIYYNKNYAAKYEEGDAPYIGGLSSPVVMASLTSDGVKTAINHLPDYHYGSRVWLNVSANTTGIYNLKLEGVRNIDTLYNIYLMDHLKKDSLDIRRYGTYAFNLVSTDTTTFGTKRFELVIQRRPIVPFVLASFAGNKVAGGVKLDWKTYNESNYTGFALEKQNSLTGQFEQIYERQSDGSGNYNFTDPAPNAGSNIYRLKENDIDGKISYSANVNVFYDKIGIAGLFSVFPNPTVETINVSIPDNQSSATYKMRLYDTSGNLLLQKSSNTSNWTENVGKLKPGAYIIEVIKSNGTTLGKAKFIKRQ